MCIGNSNNTHEIIVSSQSYNFNETIASNADLFENSDYCTLDEVDKETTKCYDLTIMHLNVWGLLSKYDKLLSMLHELEEKNPAPDITFLCENSLVDKKVPLCEFKEYNMKFVNRQNHKNGDIAILICKNLSYTPRLDLQVFRKEFSNHVLLNWNVKMLITLLLDQAKEFLEVMRKLL